MGAKRRTFSREFKLEAVRQLEGGRRVSELARELGIQETVLRRWRKEMAVDEETAFPGNGRRLEPEDELERLRKEVAQLRMERDFLKRAAAFFAKESQ